MQIPVFIITTNGDYTLYSIGSFFPDKPSSKLSCKMECIKLL